MSLHENKKLNRDLDSPIYVQLREIIRNKIENGEYIPGGKIPSESEFVDEYGLNRLTVRNAIGSLVKEGLLKQVKGKGVYVIGKKMERNLETLVGFTKTIVEQNSLPKKKVIFRDLRPAGLKYGTIFNVPEDEPIYHIKRIGYSDDEPITIEDIYILANLIPGFEKVDLSLFSLYDIFEFNNILLSNAWQTLSIVTLDAKDARFLKIEPKDSVFMFECTSVDTKGKVIEFTRSYTRSDKCNFTTLFSKGNESGDEAFLRIIGRKR